MPVWKSYRQVLSNSFFTLFCTQLMASQEGQEENWHADSFLSALVRDGAGTRALRSGKEIPGAVTPGSQDQC